MANTLTWHSIPGSIRVDLDTLLAPYWQLIAESIDLPRVSASIVSCSRPRGSNDRDLMMTFAELLRNQGYPFTEFAAHARSIYKGSLADDLAKIARQPIDPRLDRLLRNSEQAPGADVVSQ